MLQDTDKNVHVLAVEDYPGCEDWVVGRYCSRDVASHGDAGSGHVAHIDPDAAEIEHIIEARLQCDARFYLAVTREQR